MAISNEVGVRIIEYLNSLEHIRYIHTEKFDPEICLCPMHKETNWSFLETQLMILLLPDENFRPTSSHHWYCTRYTIYYRHLRVPDYCESFISYNVSAITDHLMKFIAAGVKGSRMWVVSHVQVEYLYTKSIEEK